MRTRFMTLAVAAASASLLLGGLAGCSADDAGDGGDSGEIAFLMPDRASTRYEEQDSPLFKKKVAELCEGCEVMYQNADGDASKQQQQVESMVARGVDVIVIDAVDTTAAASSVQSAQSSGIKVVTYDRPVPKVSADFYVSFDNKEIGKLIAQSLVDHLDDEGVKDGGLLMVNGSPSDDAAMLIKEGSEEVVKDSDFDVLASYDTPDWVPQKAQDWVSGQISQYRDDIDGVVAANDGTAGGTIAAFKAAGVDDMPPVTGNDAEVAAVQRAISGAQYNTISKPISIVAEKAAEVAVGFVKGETPDADDELFDTPSALFVPDVVTAENVKKVIFDEDIYSADKVCTEEYASACEDLGIE